MSLAQALDTALRMAPSSRLPPSFVVLARELEELRNRLSTFAEVSAETHRTLRP